MKEVLQGNLSLRETIQKQSELIDDQNAEIFQLQNENEDLRERLQIMEDHTGKDSKYELQRLFKDNKVLEQRVMHLEATSNSWMQMRGRQPRDLKPNSIGLVNTNIEQAKSRQYENQFPKGNTDFEPVRPTIYDSGKQKTSYSNMYSQEDYTEDRQNFNGRNLVKSSNSNMNVGASGSNQVVSSRESGTMLTTKQSFMVSNQSRPKVGSSNTQRATPNMTN